MRKPQSISSKTGNEIRVSALSTLIQCILWSLKVHDTLERKCLYEAHHYMHQHAHRSFPPFKTPVTSTYNYTLHPSVCSSGPHSIFWMPSGMSSGLGWGSSPESCLTLLHVSTTASPDSDGLHQNSCFPLPPSPSSGSLALPFRWL